MAAAVSVSATGNAEIDGLLGGTRWSGSITFSFPDSPNDYPSTGYSLDNEPAVAGFASAPAAMQAAINYAINLIKGYTNISISYAGTGTADIQIAQSPAANPTSHAYYPGNYSAGGDIWFGTAYNYSNGQLGNYLFATALHELGHALGLKHSQETGGVANVAVPYAHDNSEFSIMSYRSYAGAPLTGYTAETYGFSQTYMANDILALQTLYGANYNTQSGNTVYTFSSTTGQMFINGVGQLAPGGGAGGSANRVFETIWDGNGVDTYDLSNYTTSVSIDLNPGASSITSTTQLAYLGNGHYAQGNIYNAYLFNGDLRSLIDNAVGGSAGDTLVGNVIANSLNGGGGNDTITGNGGNDAIIGGSGTDTAVYSGNKANYTITYNSATQTFTIVDTRGGTPDGTDTVTGVENFQFLDGTVTAASLIAASSVIEAFGSTSLTVASNTYYLYGTGTGSGPSLKFGSTPIAVGSTGIWTPVGAEQTSTGYEVAFKGAGADQYMIWFTDSSGSYLSSVQGTGGAISIYESSFQQDLNGDGAIGPVGSAIDSFGSTSLDVIGNTYYLYSISSGTGPSLKIGTTPIVAGSTGMWTPIGAEQSAGGYQVAFKVAGNDQYMIWNTDSNGTYLNSFQGNGAAIASYESNFHQDLNGDGLIGLPDSTIESFGSTRLVVAGHILTLNPIGGGSGATLKIGSAPIPVDSTGIWTPIAAEQTAGGYMVAWKVAGADQYMIWTTDSSGAYLSNVQGNGAAITSYESTFQQDLNGDGVIGAGSAVESFGLTSLSVNSGIYCLYDIGNGTGPSLKYGATPIAVGTTGIWTPIGAEQTGGGYEVAWKVAGNDQYMIWFTDSNGVYLSSLQGNGAWVASYESSFQQDLNGDGTVSQAPLAQANSAAGAAQHADGFLQCSGHSDFLADLAWTASDEVGANRDMNGNGFVSQAPLAPGASPADAPDPFPMWTPSDTAATDIFAGQQAFAFGSDSGTPTSAPQVTIPGLGDGNLAPPTQSGAGDGSLPDSHSTFAPASFDGWLNDVQSLSNLVFGPEMGSKFDSAVGQFLGIADGNFAPSPETHASAGDAGAPMPDSADAVVLPAYVDMHPHLVLV